jgi:hypothetical protein
MNDIKENGASFFPQKVSLSGFSAIYSQNSTRMNFCKRLTRAILINAWQRSSVMLTNMLHYVKLAKANCSQTFPYAYLTPP